MSTRDNQIKSQKPSRRERVQALLFSGAAIGTTMLMIGDPTGPKLPPLKGD